jgi:hypothetical protein
MIQKRIIEKADPQKSAKKNRKKIKPKTPSTKTHKKRVSNSNPLT